MAAIKPYRSIDFAYITAFIETQVAVRSSISQRTCVFTLYIETLLV